MKTTCSQCDEPQDRNGRYCRQCHNAYMRQWRIDRPISDAERHKSNTRAYTHVLIKRGKLTKEPCRTCASVEVHAHHPDYNDPRNVVWLCPLHHRDEHARLNAARELVTT